MNNELYHHGVKGMRWGVRKADKSSGSARSKSPDRQAKEDRKSDSKNRRLLSNAELDQKIQRLQKEKQLKDLTDEQLNPGKRIVSSTLTNVGTRVAGTVLAGTALWGIRAAVTKIFDGTPYATAAKEALSYIAPKPKRS